ncbi:hypothetical protein BB561_004827 [Smittium simulii]|uniref:Probable RNA polymerase II nuclear localization protein SLC7A6OS n=1 Tax=Smittium simulii TaxID=133385 RepID=A0A2T9YDX1_9FUNG|nr:hypothetical protein BB561_004827 [Smittium simulii]
MQDSNTASVVVLRVKRKRGTDSVDAFVVPNSTESSKKTKSTQKLPTHFTKYATVQSSTFDRKIHTAQAFQLNKTSKSSQEDTENSLQQENTLKLYDLEQHTLNNTFYMRADASTLNEETSENYQEEITNMLASKARLGSNTLEQLADSDKEHTDDEEYVYDMYCAVDPLEEGKHFQNTNEAVLKKRKIATLLWTADDLACLVDKDSDEDSCGYDSDDSNAENYYANDYPDEDYISGNEYSTDCDSHLSYYSDGSSKEYY